MASCLRLLKSVKVTPPCSSVLKFQGSTNGDASSKPRTSSVVNCRGLSNQSCCRRKYCCAIVAGSAGLPLLLIQPFMKSSDHVRRSAWDRKGLVVPTKKNSVRSLCCSAKSKSERSTLFHRSQHDFQRRKCSSAAAVYCSEVRARKFWASRLFKNGSRSCCGSSFWARKPTSKYAEFVLIESRRTFLLF